MALQIFQTMLQSSVQSQNITYNAAISACEKGAEWEKALQLFEIMVRSQVTLDTITYNAAISACEKVGRWESALHLCNAMVQNNVDAIGTCIVLMIIAACFRRKPACWQSADAILVNFLRAMLAATSLRSSKL